MAAQQKPKKAAPDWERIEGEYRAGILSVREIAAAHGISHTAIQKRAKADGWHRDLRKRIQDKADALVAKRQVATQVAVETAQTERVLVDANAQVVAEIRITHRADIRRARGVAISLLAELELVTGNLGLFEHLADSLAADDDKSRSRRNEIYQKVIGSASRIDSMKKLADTLRTLVVLEREAYGIGVDPGGGEDVPAGLDHFYGGDETDAESGT